MGSVERALDTQRGTHVALKRIRLDSVDPDQRERLMLLFEREYHTLSQLAHPSIVEVYDYGVDEVGPYYAMELLDGQDLKTLAPMPWKDACALMRDVASSLAIVHAR